MGHTIKTFPIYFSDGSVWNGPPVQLIKPKASPKALQFTDLASLTNESDQSIDSSADPEISHYQTAILSYYVDSIDSTAMLLLLDWQIKNEAIEN